MNVHEAIEAYGDQSVIRSIFSNVPKADRRDLYFDLFQAGFEPAEIAKDLGLRTEVVSSGVLDRYHKAHPSVKAALAPRLRIQKGIEARFWDFVLPEPNCGCWLWNGPDNGWYGLLRVGYKNTYAHRFSYELAHGPIPRGLVIDHTCRMTFCVNPDHLEAVTQGENVRRAWERKRVR